MFLDMKKYPTLFFLFSYFYKKLWKNPLCPSCSVYINILRCVHLQAIISFYHTGNPTIETILMSVELTRALKITLIFDGLYDASKNCTAQDGAVHTHKE